MSATFVFLLNPQWVSHGKWYSEELVFFVLFALFSFTILLPLTKHFKTLPLFLLNIAQRFWFMPWSPFAWMIVIPLSLVSAKKNHLNLLQIRQNSAARITSTKSTDHTTGHPALLAPHSPVNPIHSSVCHFQSSPQLGPLLSIKFPSSSHPFPCSRAPVIRLTGPCFRLETMVATTFIYSTFISQALCYTVASQRNTHLFTSAYQL